MPTIVESPPIEVNIVESLDPNGPFGAKEASEGALPGFPPALAAAVDDAIGIRLRRCRSRPTACSRRSSEAARRAAACAAQRAPQRGRRAHRRGVDTCDRMPEFQLMRPATSPRPPRLLAAAPEPGCWPAAPICCPTCGAACERPRCLIDLGRCRASTASSCSDGRTGASAPASRWPRSPTTCRAGAGAAGAGPGGGAGGRPRPPQRGHAGRQSVPGHPLRLLQPERMVAGGQRRLPEEPRRHLPCRAPGPALPRRLQRRSGARAAGARRRGRDRGTEDAPRAAGRAVPRRRRGASDAAARRGAGRACTCRPRAWQRQRYEGAHCAARWISRWPASPWRCGWKAAPGRTGRRPDRHQLAAAAAGRHRDLARPRRRRRRCSKRWASWCASRSARCAAR